MPLGVAYDFGVKFLEVETESCDVGQINNPNDEPYVFNVLMSMSKNYSKLPDQRYKKLQVL